MPTHIDSKMHLNKANLETRVYSADELSYTRDGFVTVVMRAGHQELSMVQGRTPELLRQLAREFEAVSDKLHGIAENLETAPAAEEATANAT